MTTNNAVQALFGLIERATELGASDVFLVPGEAPAVRLPDGIVRLEGPPLAGGDIHAMAVALAGAQAVERIGAETGVVSRLGDAPEFPDAVFKIAKSRSAVTLAVQLTRPVLVDADICRIPPAVLDALKAPQGLVIFSGIDGSGKSTTAYSGVDYINSHRACHICTVEQPSYLRIPSRKALVQQRQVGLDVPSVLEGIYAAMAQDFDVLFLNNVPGIEELQACLTVAERGHLVVMLMHLPSPEEAVWRLMDLFPEDLRSACCRSLARGLGAVSAQRLLPAKKGGRLAAYGVLIPDEEMRSAIAECRDFIGRRSSLPPGCQTMIESIRALETSGSITPETAQKAIREEEQRVALRIE